MNMQTPADRVDEKGKVFTERIRKDHVEVDVLTDRGRVHGHIHVRHGERVKDVLNNKDEMFVAVTDARIDYTHGGPPEYIGFLALNKHHIVSVTPINEPHVADNEEEYYIP